MHALSKEQPFPGLRPFDYGDQEFFFGRRHQTASLYGLLDRSTFVAVIGSSGSGKSSLTKAGLLPILEEENRQSGSRKWAWCVMRPGDAPLAALAEALADLTNERNVGEQVPEIRLEHIGYQLSKTSFGLADAISEAGVNSDRRFVLVVDQFEELFRHSVRGKESLEDLLRETTLRSEAKRFVELLMEGRRSTKRDIRIIITMRSDFIGDCADFPGLPEAVSTTQFLVPGLDRDQLESIIVEPITRTGATIEPALVQELLTDVEGEPDQLPVLQHCLQRLWQQADAVSAGAEGAAGGVAEGGQGAATQSGRHIDAGCYVAIDRLSGALSAHAEKILLDLREQAVESVFRALSEFKDSKPVRRMLPYSLLRAETGIQDSELRTIVDRFRSDDCSFLVTSPSPIDRVADDTVIYVGHEALLRRWGRICGVPGATGDGRDKRPIGWMRQERRDGQKYQMLLSILNEDSASGKVEDIDRHLEWWNKLKPTEQWANRYGGKIAGVEGLLERGRKHRRNERVRFGLLVASLGVLGVTVLYQGYGYNVQQALIDQNKKLADDNFAQSISIATSFLDKTLSALNAGDIKVTAAAKMAADAQSAVTTLGTQEPSTRTLALSATLDFIATDILIRRRGVVGEAYDRAKKASGLAEQLVKSDPSRNDWQNLLYESTFRVADILADTDSKAALAAYLKARDVAQLLADRVPGAGVHQYHLAFMTVKIGEMYREGGNDGEALDQYRAALKIAEKLAADHPENPEWQAYVPSTMSKIADVQVRNGKPEEALLNYEAALNLQTKLLERFPTNAVIFSNMTSTRRSRAEVLAAKQQWSEANTEFGAVIANREKMVETDSEDVISLEYLAGDYKRFAQWLSRQTSVGLTDATNPVPNYEALLTKALDLTKKEIGVRRRLLQINSGNSAWEQSLVRAEKVSDGLKVQLESVKLPIDSQKQ